MTVCGRRMFGSWSVFVIALAIAASGLDALPLSVLTASLSENARDDSRDETPDDSPDDATDMDDLVDLSWVDSGCDRRSRRLRFEFLPSASPLACVAPAGPPEILRTGAFLAPRTAAATKLPTLLCRLTC